MWFIHFSISYPPDLGLFFCGEKFSFNAGRQNYQENKPFLANFQ